jgi:hypothetical protein
MQEAALAWLQSRLSARPTGAPRRPVGLRHSSCCGLNPNAAMLLAIRRICLALCRRALPAQAKRVEDAAAPTPSASPSSDATAGRGRNRGDRRSPRPVRGEQRMGAVGWRDVDGEREAPDMSGNSSSRSNRAIVVERPGLAGLSLSRLSRKEADRSDFAAGSLRQDGRGDSCASAATIALQHSRRARSPKLGAQR